MTGAFSVTFVAVGRMVFVRVGVGVFAFVGVWLAVGVAGMAALVVLFVGLSGISVVGDVNGGVWEVSG